MYRDGLCERKFRDRSLQEIGEEGRRWEFATTTLGMSPVQAPELVRGFAAAVQESTPEEQREVVQRVFQRSAITDDRVTDVDVYPVYADATSGLAAPRRRAMSARCFCTYSGLTARMLRMMVDVS